LKYVFLKPNSEQFEAFPLSQIITELKMPFSVAEKGIFVLDDVRVLSPYQMKIRKPHEVLSRALSSPQAGHDGIGQILRPWFANPE
jgi:hypothetical protein